jgi:hypothetical protein
VTRETEALLQEVLVELLKFLRRENEQREHEKLERRLAEYHNKRWGYPIPRRRRN